ncbi:hypothetical protein DB31_6230 [Hyalangium minutum]|uniref:Fucose-specific lectin n=1 Tax=Hyalangium minutum TaxID=394096 RepID=A0A085VU20_9BACT|nr:hypothetical protein DB31_6230 [Hyalangium minutum]
MAALGSAPPAAPGSKLTGFVVNGTQSRVYFLGANNHVYELWFDGQSWHSGDLMQRASAPNAAPGSALTGFTVNGTLSRVYFTGADNKTYELWYDSQNWHSANLTQWASAPNAAPDSALTGFAVNGNLSRTYFLSADNHVNELWYDGLNWHTVDLTATAN